MSDIIGSQLESPHNMQNAFQIQTVLFGGVTQETVEHIPQLVAVNHRFVRCLCDFFSFISSSHESSWSHSWSGSQPSHKVALHFGQSKACRPQQLCQLSLWLHSQRSVLPSTKHSLQWDVEKSGHSVQGTCVLSGPRSAQESHHTSMHTSHSRAFSSLQVHFWHCEHSNASRALKKINRVYNVSTYSSTFAKKNMETNVACPFPKWWFHEISWEYHCKCHGSKKTVSQKHRKKNTSKILLHFFHLVLAIQPLFHVSLSIFPFYKIHKVLPTIPQNFSSIVGALDSQQTTSRALWHPKKTGPVSNFEAIYPLPLGGRNLQGQTVWGILMTYSRHFGPWNNKFELYFFVLL